MLKLSLLVCTKNSANSIIKCLNSSLPILKKGAELILVDCRSSDNTTKLVLKFLEMHNIIYYKIISQLSYGLYEAFNLAIKNSSRKKILFLHSDDLLKNTKTLIADVLNSTADVIFYGVEIEGAFIKRKWLTPNLSSINVNSMFIPPHAGILVSRNLYCKIGNFKTDYKIAGDFDWMLRLLCTSNISFSFSIDRDYSVEDIREAFRYIIKLDTMVYDIIEEAFKSFDVDAAYKQINDAYQTFLVRDPSIKTAKEKAEVGPQAYTESKKRKIFKVRILK